MGRIPGTDPALSKQVVAKYRALMDHRDHAAAERSLKALRAMRWTSDYHLFVLAVCSFAFARFGRGALRRRWPFWPRLHITGMGLSCVLMLVAFYVDNGRQLPLWKELPRFAYWLLPVAVGAPLIVRALLWHPRAPEPTR